MELGNFLFGNSRGAYPVPREDDWSHCFNTLLQVIEGPQFDGYGAEFSCPVFELHRYYWGECTCGFEEAEHAWCQSNPHAPSCNLEQPDGCHCGHLARYAEWASTHTHASTCPIIRPNFAYTPMAFSLTWYKYPFRDAYMSHPLTFEEFRTIINACIAWVRDHPETIPQRQIINRSHPRTRPAHTGR